MRVLDTIQKNPAAALCVVAAAVIGWVAATISTPTPAYIPPANPPLSVGVRAAPPVMGVAGEQPTAVVTRPVPVALLSNLKPGMTRMEVEKMIGPPPSTSLHPVYVADDGRAMYRMAYDIAEPDALATVRPIGRPQRVLPRPTDPTAQVALEFDASQPGHPLLQVFYLDPLF